MEPSPFASKEALRIDIEDFTRIMFPRYRYRSDSFCSTCSPDYSPIRRQSISPVWRKGEVTVMPRERFGVDNVVECYKIAEKNARELIREEEEAKLKRIKKKAKKERQKEKKMLQKTLASHKQKTDIPPDGTNNSVDNESNDLDKISSNSEDEDDSVKSTFVTAQQVKLDKQNKKCTKTSVIKKNSKYKPKQDKDTSIDIDSFYTKALELIDQEEYNDALICLTEAIKIDPKRIDILLKRSSIYFHLADFEKSLEDAKSSLRISPFDPEGYLRQGEAHFALKNYSEADEALSKLVNNSEYKRHVLDKLFSIRMRQLVQMGYEDKVAFGALLKSDNLTIDEALDHITSLQTKGKEDDVYYSEGEDESSSSEEEEEEEVVDLKENKIETQGASRPVSILPPISIKGPQLDVVIKKDCKLLLDPSNPFNCPSIFIANMKENITYQEVYDVCVKFGEIASVKVVTSPKVYAFVNYVEWTAAGAAMQALQNSHWLLSTTKPLIIKFPDKAVNEIILNGQLVNPQFVKHKLEEEKRAKVKRSPFRSSFKPHPVGQGAFPTSYQKTETELSNLKLTDNNIKCSQSSKLGGKASFNTSGTECFYWRTSGCNFGSNCVYLHLPQSKGKGMVVKPQPFTSAKY